MKDEYIIEFGITIITKGIKNKLPEEWIINGLDTFIDYLKQRNLASKEALSVLNILKNTVPVLKEQEKEEYRRAVGMKKPVKVVAPPITRSKTDRKTVEVKEESNNEKVKTETNTPEVYISGCHEIIRPVSKRDEVKSETSTPEVYISGCHEILRHVPTRDDYVMGGCGSSPERSTSSSSDYSSSVGWDIIGEDRHTYEKSRC